MNCSLINKLKAGHLEQFQKILGSESGRAILSEANGDDLSGYLTDWTGKFKAKKKNEATKFIVLRPDSTEKVSNILKFCSEERIGIVPQGGNTGLVGGATPYGEESRYHASVVLSLARMNRIKSIDGISGVIKLEAGCILEEADRKCREQARLMLPIDLGAKGSCQIGGILATNAGGIRFLRYGSLHGSCLGLEVVLADGRIMRDMRGLRKDNTGYDLKQLFIGSEGSLGVITAAVIQAVPEPKSTNVACLQLDSFAKVHRVYQVARETLGEILSAFEFWDGACERILKEGGAIEQQQQQQQQQHPSDSFHVLIETSGSDRVHDEEKITRLLEGLMQEDLIQDGVLAQDEKQKMELWARREGIPEACSHQGGQVHKFDLSFPAARYYDLVPLLREHAAVLEGRIKVFGFGHVGDGNIHINLVALKHHNEDHREEIKMISEFIFDWTSRNGGSISAEHGIGQAKLKELSLSKGPVEIDLMRSFKSLLDPYGILNPGKVLI